LSFGNGDDLRMLRGKNQENAAILEKGGRVQEKAD